MTEKFFLLSKDIARRRNLTSTDKIVLVAIADRIGANARSWPGMRTIADDVGVDKNSVVRAIEHLEKTGDLIVERTGKGKRNYYSLADKTVGEPQTVFEEECMKNADASVGDTHTVAKGGCMRNADTGVGEAHTQLSEKRILNYTYPITRPTKDPPPPKPQEPGAVKVQPEVVWKITGTPRLKAASWPRSKN